MTAWTHQFGCKVSAPPERVFSALTDAGELSRWFAERVEVEPRVGGAFRFWGKHTYGTPSRKDATQRVTQLAAPSTVGFTWRVEHQESEVVVALAPSGASGSPATEVTVRHQFPAAPAVARPRELIDDLWRLTLGNLDAHLKGGAGIVLPDYADPRPEIRLSILIDAPREQVFQALLVPEALNRWIAASAEVEPRVGGRYSYGWSYQIDGRAVCGGPTRILVLVPNEKLVTDWPDWRGDESVPNTTITWQLESVGSKTRVTLIHAGFPRAVDQSDYPFGWGEFLGRLKEVMEAATAG